MINMRIQKKVHYCWFGYGEKSDLIKKCIESWRINLPEYEVVEWNEQNFDVNICSYTKDAYEAGKFAFVSDFARFYILYHHGGIYMDVDVEVLKPLDRFLMHEAFTGFEDSKNIAPGLILGAKKENAVIKQLLDSYLTREFVLKNGNFNLTPVVKYTTEILVEHGLILNNTYQVINGVALYPKTFFNPKAHNSNKEYFTEETYTIHHFAGSWLTEKQKRRNKCIVWKTRIFVLKTIKLMIVRIVGKKKFETIKFNLRKVKL